MECLVSTDIDILNASNEPAFVISNRKEIIDLRLGNDIVGDGLTSWHVCDEICLSENRYILFQVGNLEVTRLTICNPKRTYGKSYQKDLKGKSRGYTKSYTLSLGCRAGC